MKGLYIDCAMGAAGDMLTAALLELVDDKDEMIEKFNSLGVEGVNVSYEPMTKCGIKGTHMLVKVSGEEENSGVDVDITNPESLSGGHDHHHEHGHDHEHCHEHEHEHSHNHGHDNSHTHEGEHHHSHTHLKDIETIVGKMPVSDKVKEDIISVYTLIAEAESNAHGCPVSDIHFHEVGSKDAIIDVASVCILMEKLDPKKVIVSPVHVGSGQVKCAHGILPVPAPATAYILRGIPIYGGAIKGELCTPTGAALLKHFATEFGNMPVMTVRKIGYGMGKKDFEVCNAVRISYADIN